jgi:NTE family protein
MSWGLVLGGGGVLGGAWMVGALAALQEVRGLDVRDADVIVGTSAGSVMAALIGAGVSVDQLRAHQLGDAQGAGALADLEWDHDTATGGSAPARPASWGPGAAGLLTSNLGRVRTLPPGLVVAALLPSGRGTLDAVARLVRDVGGLADGAAAAGRWSAHAHLRVTAVDLDAGRRVVFGDADAPPVALHEAVSASCAIPGWFSPVVLDGVRYVDGGAWSATNVDVTAGRGLDEVVVLAPMVSFAPGSTPTTWRARVERRWRQAASRRCLREVDVVHAEGTEVTVLGPGAEDLQVMGSNLMDVDRRRRVLDTSLRTSVAALSDPGPVPRPAPVAGSRRRTARSRIARTGVAGVRDAG